MTRSFVARALVRLPLPAGWIDGLLPIVCLGCERSIRGPEAPSLGLCAPCRSRLRPAPPGIEVPRSIDQLLACYRYEPPLDTVVRALKFRRLDYLGRHLGVELAEQFGSQLAELDAIVSVPLAWRRRLTRGFDQAEGIARALAREIETPYLNALRRQRATRPQTFRGQRERKENLRGAFALRRRIDVRGLRLALVDDVTTTGATLSAAASALRAGGAREILGVVAAWTPE